MEQSKKCPKCGEEILASAKKCKHCQADLRNWFVRHKIITGILILIVIGIIGSASGDESQKADTASNAGTKADTNQNEKPVEPVKLAPQVTITSANLSKEYSENEVAADSKYKGKLIEISGKITSIDNGITDNEIIIKLSDGKYDISGAMCYMKASEHEKVLTFKKGQQVTLIGTGNSATLGSPILKDCTVK